MKRRRTIRARSPLEAAWNDAVRKLAKHLARLKRAGLTTAEARKLGVLIPMELQRSRPRRKKGR